MTTVAVLCDPPRAGLVLPDIAENTPLSMAEAAELYAALLKDVIVAVDRSGGELLVNYRPEASLPASHRAGEDEPAAEAMVRAVVADVLETADATRIEVQVGETFAARVGNTVTHLLTTEGVQTVAVVEPTAAFLGRTDIDNGAMKLRRRAVVVGPSTDGRVYYAGFAAAPDFTDAFAPPAVETLTDRAIDAGHGVDFLPVQPMIETGADLPSAISILRARGRAGLSVPEHTLAAIDGWGLSVTGADGLELVR